MKKFVSLLLSVALFFLTIPLASAQYYVKTTEEVGYSDVPAFYFFSQIGTTEDANAKAMITATVLHLLQKAQNSSEYGQGFYRLDKEAPVFFCNTFSDGCFWIFCKSEYLGCYLLLKVFEKSTTCHTIIPSDSISATDSFLSIGDPYETPEQIIEYLDSQSFAYCTLSSEELDEATALLHLK